MYKATRDRLYLPPGKKLLATKLEDTTMYSSNSNITFTCMHHEHSNLYYNSTSTYVFEYCPV